MILRAATRLAKSLAVSSQVGCRPAGVKPCPAAFTDAPTGVSKGLMLWKFQNNALLNYLADGTKPFRGIIRIIQKEPDGIYLVCVVSEIGLFVTLALERKGQENQKLKASLRYKMSVHPTWVI